MIAHPRCRVKGRRLRKRAMRVAERVMQKRAARSATFGLLLELCSAIVPLYDEDSGCH